MIANTILGVAIALQAAQAGTELLPAPTGPHKTGRMTFHWKDSARDELETSARNDKRELMVHVFYPADASAQGNRAAYMPDADAMRPPFNDAQVARITGGDSGSGAQPFLWIQRSLPAPPSAEQLQRARRTRAQYDSVIRVMLAGWDRRLGGVSGGAMRVYIERPGVEHIDFSDEPGTAR